LLVVGLKVGSQHQTYEYLPHVLCLACEIATSRNVSERKMLII
jgi:hypothetical protein